MGPNFYITRMTESKKHIIGCFNIGKGKSSAFTVYNQEGSQDMIKRQFLGDKEVKGQKVNQAIFCEHKIKNEESLFSSNSSQWTEDEEQTVKKQIKSEQNLYPFNIKLQQTEQSIQKTTQFQKNHQESKQKNNNRELTLCLNEIQLKVMPKNSSTNNVYIQTSDQKAKKMRQSSKNKIDKCVNLTVFTQSKIQLRNGKTAIKNLQEPKSRSSQITSSDEYSQIELLRLQQKQNNKKNTKLTKKQQKQLKQAQVQDGYSNSNQNTHHRRKELKQNQKFVEELQYTGGLRNCKCCGKLITKLCFKCPHIYCNADNCPRKRKKLANQRMLERMKKEKIQQHLRQRQLYLKIKQEKGHSQSIPGESQILSEKLRSKQNSKKISHIDYSQTQESFIQSSQSSENPNQNLLDYQIGSEKKRQINKNNKGKIYAPQLINQKPSNSKVINKRKLEIYSDEEDEEDEIQSKN